MSDQSGRPFGFVAILLSAMLLFAGAGCAAHRTELGEMKQKSGTFESGNDLSQAHRLQAIWHDRINDTRSGGFALGPGDILEISAPLEQLEKCEARVSPQDTVEIPIVGEIDLHGMSEEDLRATLRSRLSAYMRDPPVSVFVKSYGSRQVAVIGAVEKPGLYTLMSRSDSLMDMISRAGGMTQNAAAQVIFVPATAVRPSVTKARFLDDAKDVGAEDGTDESSATATDDRGATRIRQEPAIAPGPARVQLVDQLPPDVQSITIDLTQTNAINDLAMPARPGDTLIVPAAGEVTVGGWVQNPGAYRITPGMTALGAVSAAGGALFSTTAEVLRTSPHNQRASLSINLRRVQNGSEADVPLQAGDVVVVDRSAVGLIPYALYEVFTKFGTGMYLPAP